MIQYYWKLNLKIRAKRFNKHQSVNKWNETFMEVTQKPDIKW